METRVSLNGNSGFSWWERQFLLQETLAFCRIKDCNWLVFRMLIRLWETLRIMRKCMTKQGGTVGNSCRTRSDIEKSRNNIEKTFLNTYLLSLNVILYGNEFSPQSNTGVSRSSILLISNWLNSVLPPPGRQCCLEQSHEAMDSSPTPQQNGFVRQDHLASWGDRNCSMGWAQIKMPKNRLAYPDILYFCTLMAQIKI